jgi:hypothetical protein
MALVKATLDRWRHGRLAPFKEQVIPFLGCSGLPLSGGGRKREGHDPGAEMCHADHSERREGHH